MLIAPIFSEELPCSRQEALIKLLIAQLINNAVLAAMRLSDEEESRVIEMAWEDRTPFEAITHQFGLSEADVIALMRQCLKSSSFKLWRRRVSGRATKHLQLRSVDVSRGYSPDQYKHR